MTCEQDAQIFLGQVSAVAEPLAVNIESGEITVADARVTCIEGIASAFGHQVELYETGEEAAAAESEIALHESSVTAADTERYLLPGEVADILGVSPKTVTRWANNGDIIPVVTLGGHRRFRPEDVQALAERMGIL